MQHSDRTIQILLSVILGLAVFGIFGQALGYGFVLYDDLVYLGTNERVKEGLSFENILWSFTTFSVVNWHPLTWLSYLLDVELFGFDARGFHFTNILLHAMNSILLFWWLCGATKRLWCSAIVAILFAVHPLHVESVAWISERKDVLSTFFMLLTLIAYSRYVRNPSSRIYVAVELLFACALLAKSMIVMLPLVLLLLDVWPYGRLSQNWSVKRLVTEKIPLFALSGAAAAMTLFAQSRVGAVVSLDDWPIIRRPLTATAAYGIYALQTVFPYQLSVIYPRYWGPGLWLGALAGSIFLLVMTYLSIRTFKRHPYLLIGWFWFLITLIPVIGIVQVGKTAHADRYTYVPQIGLLVMGAWLLAYGVSIRPRLKALVVSLCLGVSILYAVAAHRQVGVWENSETLFRNASARSHESEWIRWFLAKALMESKKNDEALAQFDRALDLKPGFPEAIFTKTRLLKEMGRLEEAELSGLQIVPPEHLYTRFNRLLGEIFLEREKYDEAVERFEIVLEKIDYDIDARVNLGIALTKSGRPEEGIVQFRQVIERNIQHVAAHYNHGLALTQVGEFALAVAAFERTIELQSDHSGAHQELTRLLEAAGGQDDAIPNRNALDE